MKFKKLFTLTAIFLSTTMLFGCAKKDEFNPSFKDKGQKIYLYGEFHGVKKIYEEELKIIEKHYNEGVRDMFIETSFATSEFLNIWMKEKDNNILDELFEDFKGTFVGTELNRNFYLKIKEKFPEIRFHGTDIEHLQTSYRYSMYLDENNIKDDFARKFISDNREQQRIFKDEKNFGYREEKMVENFKRQYEKVGNKSILGFYGDAHLYLDNSEKFGKNKDNFIMGDELKKLYGNNLVLTSLVDLLGYQQSEEIKTTNQVLKINGKEYNTKYFGKDEADFSDKVLEMWKLEDAYEDFKDYKEIESGEFNGMAIFMEENSIFRIKFTYKDKSEKVQYYKTKNENINGRFKGYLVKEEK